MSGGYFDNKQFALDYIVDSMEDYVFGHDLTDSEVKELLSPYCFVSEEESEYIKKNKHTLPNRYHFSDKTLEKFTDIINRIKSIQKLVDATDYLLSGDYDENDFMDKLIEYGEF